MSSTVTGRPGIVSFVVIEPVIAAHIPTFPIDLNTSQTLSLFHLLNKHQHRLELMFLPPYSPDLNLIEGL
ncbi:hypothetical protein D0U04_14010 [Bacillus clarus]|uniref:Tc1-like transposase DDE domain-containing protein n=1 Tax=Bacillus clarus TaxID=2338372 RepID=A0ABX9KUF0_9BACI|nr:hypothetical protein D0U04_14010 [Bacillus clarus]